MHTLSNFRVENRRLQSQIINYCIIKKRCMKNYQQARVKLNISISLIVRMPGKMRAALNQFSTQRHENEEAKFPRKIWAFLEKKKIYYFYVSSNVDLWKGGPQGKSQRSPMLSF